MVFIFPYDKQSFCTHLVNKFHNMFNSLPGAKIGAVIDTKSFQSESSGNIPADIKYVIVFRGSGSVTCIK